MHNFLRVNGWIQSGCLMSNLFSPPPAGAVSERPAYYITSSGSKRNNPSPGSYNVEKSIGSDKPTISMHVKHKEYQDINTVPYRELPTTIGEGPKSTIGKRIEPQQAKTRELDYVPPAFGSNSPHIGIGSVLPKPKIDETPAPGAYRNTKEIGEGARACQMHGTSNRSPYDISSTPGPGNYSPSRTPLPGKITIGTQPSKRAKCEETPAPGQYNDPRRLKPDASKGRIHERSVSRESAVKPPGPGNYNIRDSDPLKDTRPIYMRSRPETKYESNDVELRDTRRPFCESPGLRIGERTPERKSRAVESTYTPSDFGKDGKKVTISPRGKDRTPREVVPAPGSYYRDVPFGSDAKSSSMGTPRDKVKSAYSSRPGPGSYSPDYTAGKTSSPKYTISGAVYSPKKDKTPEYRNLGSTLGGPKYSIRGGHKPEISYC